MTRQKTWVLLVALFATHACAYGANWPQWGGVDRDAKSPDTGLLKTWPPEGPSRAWLAEGIGKGHAAPCVVNGTVYVTGMDESGLGQLSAIDSAGSLLWRTAYGREWEQTYPGARSTPAYDDGSLYILSSMGLAVCCDAQTGKIAWSEDVAKKFNGLMPRCGFSESLLLYEGNVICTPGGKDASLVALDKKTGETRWTTQGFNDQSGYCSPLLIDRGGQKLIVTLTARHVVGIDPANGSVLWSQAFDTEAEDPNHCVTPAYRDGFLYATSGHRDGGQMFTLSPDGKQASPAWADKVLNTSHGGIIAVDGYLYGTNLKDKWICLELKTGNVMYETRGVGMGSVAYADGMLYCYGEKGTMALVPASPKAYEIVSSFKIAHGDGQHWAHPVIADGRLYVRHGNALACYALR